ncbi:MAG: LytTR family transcriptional regulator DNA-binding domain-containing protein [Marinicella sp.]
MDLDSKYSFRLLTYCGILLLAILLSKWVLNQSGKNFQWLASQVKYQIYDSPSYAEPNFDDRHWQSAALNQIPITDQNHWIRTTIDVPNETFNNPPYALFLSGLFSAEVYLNGQRIFSKGDIDSTIAGLIDSAIYLPEDELLSDTPHLAMRISTKNAGYTVDTPFHIIGIAEYDADARRELRYYAVPLVLSSAFLLLAFQFFRIARAGGTPHLNYLALASAFALFQLLSEVSRSFVSYPYDWHLYRSFLIWGFNLLSMMFLVGWYINRLKTRKLWVSVSLVLMLIASYFIAGFDQKTTVVIQITSAFLLLGLIFNRKNDLLIIAVVLLGLVWLAISQFDTIWLLDIGFYVSFMVFLSFVWWWISSGSQSSDSPAKEPSDVRHITIKATGKLTKIAVQDVLYIKAEGNFAEIFTVDGKTHLHHLRLGQIMENPPNGLLRIHRSYAVNMDKVSALKSKEGSRYYAEINDQLIPVSRYKLADFRQAFSYDSR